MRVILILLLLAGPFKNFAQEPTFPIADASWVTTHISNICIGGTNYHYYWTEFLDGDTLIDGKTYQNLWLLPHCIIGSAGSHCPAFFSSWDEGAYPVGGIIEENGKVIFRKFIVENSLFQSYERALKNIPAGTEILIYDMNWTVGDSVIYPLENGDWIVFDVYGILEQDGKKEFGLQLRDGPTWKFVQVIEGMGGKRGLFNMYYYDQITSQYAAVPVCFYINDQLIHEGEYCENGCQYTGTNEPSLNEIYIFPNPATDQIFVTIDKIDVSPILIVIRNNVGQAIYHEKINHGNSNEIMTINTTELLPGMYTMFVYSENNQMGVKKFIIAR